MNDIVDVKKMLERYYRGESTDLEEQALREYFTSGEVAGELLPYCAIFACLQREREQSPGRDEPVPESAAIRESAIPLRPANWRYGAAVAAACLLAAVFIPRENRPASQALCSSTYVMINGICYDDLVLVRKYAVETIDLITQPLGESSATDALDFLSEE